MKVSFLGRCFPQWPSRLGKRRWRMQRNTTAAQLCKTGESATTAVNPGSEEGKCQQYTKHKRERGRREGRKGGGGNSITSASSFTGQRDREPELWTTNEIKKSWVRYLSPSCSGGKQQKGETRRGMKVWAEKTAGPRMDTATEDSSFPSAQRVSSKRRRGKLSPSTLIPLS